MHCLGQSKIVAKLDVRFAKLPLLKVILLQLCANSAASPGPAGESQSLDKCSARLSLVFILGQWRSKLPCCVGYVLFVLGG